MATPTLLKTAPRADDANTQRMLWLLIRILYRTARMYQGNGDSKACANFLVRELESGFGCGRRGSGVGG